KVPRPESSEKLAMFRLSSWCRPQPCCRRADRRRSSAQQRCRLTVETLEDRIAPALFATGNDGHDLIQIDPTTGQAATIGSMVAGLPAGSSAYPGAFTPNGTFWTIVNVPGTGAIVATVNLTTAALTPVGPANPIAATFVGLEADSSGNLFA